MKYRKKPVEIEAVQWTGENLNEIIEFVDGRLNYERNFLHNTTKMSIPTLEGDMTVSIYDFIIKGVNGEFYPCKPDIFEKTYERVCL